MNIPVLIVAFNRPDLAARVAIRIASLSPSRIYVAVDGPRPGRTGDEQAVAATIDQIRTSLASCPEVRWLIQNTNLGCRIGVETAVSWIAANEEFFAVFEDDCLPAEDIFTWLNYARAIGESLNQRAVIACFNHFATLNSSQWFLSSYFSVWGWATWSVIWRNHCLDAKTLLERMAGGAFDRVLGPLEQANWRLHLQRIQSGLVDTWDAQWLLSLVLAQIPIVVPGSSFVQNIGFARVDATHTSTDYAYADAESVGQRDWNFAGLSLCHQYDRALAQKDYMTKGWFRLLMTPYRDRLKQGLRNHPRLFDKLKRLKKSLSR